MPLPPGVFRSASGWNRWAVACLNTDPHLQRTMVTTQELADVSPVWLAWTAFYGGQVPEEMSRSLLNFRTE
jgi:hypothetical protein